MSSPAIQFKGTGWYITDYAKKSSSGARLDGRATEASDDEAKSDERQSRQRATRPNRRSDVDDVLDSSTSADEHDDADSRRLEASSATA